MVNISGVGAVPGVGGGAGPPGSVGASGHLLRAGEEAAAAQQNPREPAAACEDCDGSRERRWRQPCSVQVQAEFQDSGTSRWKGVG